MFNQEDIVSIDAIDYLDEPILLGEGYAQVDEPMKEPLFFSWHIKNFGFGETVFYYQDGKLKCDNEAMSKESIKMLLCAFVEKAEFQS